MTTWEYTYLYWFWDGNGDPMASMVPQLKWHGEAGWELVTVASGGAYMQGFWFVATLKRPTN